MNAGTVDFLLILGGNPVYTAPADLQFGAALQKVRAARARRAVRRRDRRAVPVARARGALPRGVERRARRRRHGDHRAAAHRAALRRQVARTKCWWRSARGGERSGLRPRARALGEADGPVDGGARRAAPLAARTPAPAPAAAAPAAAPAAGGAAAGDAAHCRRSRRSRPRPGAGAVALRSRVAPLAARRRSCRTPRSRPKHGHAARRDAGARRAGGGSGPRGRVPARSRASTTAASPTTPGCRSCRSR